MAKFYVQCGSSEMVVSADSAKSAALAMIHRQLHSHLWIYDDPDLAPLDRFQHLMIEALLHLPTELKISEQGFNKPGFAEQGFTKQRFNQQPSGDQAVHVMSVPELIQQWHQLVSDLKLQLARAQQPVDDAFDRLTTVA